MDGWRHTGQCYQWPLYRRCAEMDGWAWGRTPASRRPYVRREGRRPALNTHGAMAPRPGLLARSRRCDAGRDLASAMTRRGPHWEGGGQPCGCLSGGPPSAPKRVANAGCFGAQSSRSARRSHGARRNAGMGLCCARRRAGRRDQQPGTPCLLPPSPPQPNGRALLS